MSKHTPGPWTLTSVSNGNITHQVPIDVDSVSLLTFVLEGEDGETPFGAVYSDADARLIAAAPTLLSALTAMLADTVFDGTPATRQAYDAIRDATGESRYRVWPDGIVQDADEIPYEWMSDDYRIVWAENEEDAANEQ